MTPGTRSLRTPLVSVVITTKNSARTLPDVLVSVIGQTVVPEVLVVDNESTDDTSQITSQFDCRLLRGRGERSSQRNLGVKEAKGKWLLILDGDMILPSHAVEKCLATVGGNPRVTVAIPQIGSGIGWLAKARDLEKKCYVGDDLLEAPRFMSKEFFQIVDGYDERLCAAEDWDLAARLRTAGARVERIDEAIVHLDGRLRLVDLFRKMSYYQPSLAIYRSKHPELASKQLSLRRPALSRNWKILLRQPRLALGIALLKTAEVAGFVWGSALRSYSHNQVAAK